MNLQHDFCHNTECAASAAADGEEDVGVLARVGYDGLARGKDNDGFEKIVTSHAVRAAEPSVAATCDPADDAYAGICAANDDFAVWRQEGLDLTVGVTCCYTDCFC